MQGINPFEISVFRHYVEEIRRGTFALDGGVTTVMEELTGRQAESFKATARRYAAQDFARQTLARRIKAAMKFAVTPFLPGYDFAAWDRQQNLPMPPNPSFSIDDDRWRAEHRALMAARPHPAPLRDLAAVAG